MTDFSSKLKGERKRLDLTQVDMAHVLDVSWVTVWRWENGKNEPNSLYKKAILKKLKDLSYE